MAEILSRKILKRRDRLYIIADILSLAKNGIAKTQIMYKANLSFAQLNEYLSFLLDTKLVAVVVHNEKDTYKTTSKGMRYLQNYAKIRNLMDLESMYIIEGQPANERMDATERPEAESYVSTYNSEDMVSAVQDVDTRLRLLETRLSDFLSRNSSFRYCPYCGKGLDKQKRKVKK